MRTLEETLASIGEHIRLREEEDQPFVPDEPGKDARAELEALYARKGILPIFWDEYWDTWEADTPEKRKALDIVKNKAWETNLFLCGRSGTGKSHLAACLAKDGAVYRELPSIFREVRMDFKAEQDVIDFHGTVDLLVLDEVCRQKFTPFEKDLFLEIVNKRWGHKKPTTLITNQDEENFSAEYGTAVLDRLRPLVVRFDWDSRRKRLDLGKGRGTQ